MSKFTTQTVTAVEHFTDRLFRFRTSRDASFRFRSGEFVMIGMGGEDKPVLRAYSVASPSWDEELEFFSIKVEDGPLTSKLQKIQPGDPLVIGKKPTGTLVLDALTPGKRLYMFSTGTGFAPFASLVRDPETYEKFEEIVVTHTTRMESELAYSKQVIASLADDPLVGEIAPNKIKHITSCTRQTYPLQQRITTLIESGKLFELVGAKAFDPKTDRVMICGSMEMINDTKQLVETFGFTEGSNSKPAEYVVEKAFAG